MRLHKTNKNGTLSVVIPKGITEVLGWQAGHDCTFQVLGDGKLLVTNATLMTMVEPTSYKRAISMDTMTMEELRQIIREEITSSQPCIGKFI